MKASRSMEAGVPTLPPSGVVQGAEQAAVGLRWGLRFCTSKSSQPMPGALLVPRPH